MLSDILRAVSCYIRESRDNKAITDICILFVLLKWQCYNSCTDLRSIIDNDDDAAAVYADDVDYVSLPPMMMN